MKKLFVTMIVCMMATASSFAQYTTNYYNRYGSSVGSSTTRSSYGSSTTNYYNQYGGSTGRPRHVQTMMAATPPTIITSTEVA